MYAASAERGFANPIVSRRGRRLSSHLEWCIGTVRRAARQLRRGPWRLVRYGRLMRPSEGWVGLLEGHEGVLRGVVVVLVTEW